MPDTNITEAEPEAKPKKERKPRVKKVKETIPDEPRLCACGCGNEAPRNAKTGRRPKFFKRYCQKIYHDAQLLGWNEGTGEITARQFMEVQRANKLPRPETDTAPALDTLINPVICACGCGARARFATAACARAFKKNDTAQ